MSLPSAVTVVVKSRFYFFFFFFFFLWMMVVLNKTSCFLVKNLNAQFPLASDSEFNGKFCLLVFFSHV